MFALQETQTELAASVNATNTTTADATTPTVAIEGIPEGGGPSHLGNNRFHLSESVVALSPALVNAGDFILTFRLRVRVRVWHLAFITFG
jgi:hypothetical protein